MNRRSLTVALAALFTATAAVAQTSLPIPWNIQMAINKGTRTATGEPGPHYWQNRADYRIRVSFDPATRLVRGSETITYTNNSPDSLQRLLFKLYPNLYKRGVPRLMGVMPEDLTDGVSIGEVSINGVRSHQGVGKGRGRRPNTEGTNMMVSIPTLQSGGQVSVALDFSYTLNKTSHIRTGQVDSGAFFIAYFFPRIAVYDDIDGWNTFPYLGSQEFYNDFCHFTVDVTVPGGLSRMGHGQLLTNAPDVLKPEYVSPMAQALQSRRRDHHRGCRGPQVRAITQHAARFEHLEV